MSTVLEVEEAVRSYVYQRNMELTPSSLVCFDDDDIARLAVNKDGYVVFRVDNVEIDDVDDGTWYVKATIFFAVDEGEEIEGSEDVYACYQNDDGTWIVDWYAS